MFTKKPHTDIKKSTSKIQDIKKDSATRLRHLKVILENVDIEEAKSIFETNYSHVYYILYDIFDQAETNLRQRVHKAHRDELDGSLWLLEKVLCLLPELIAKRWQCNSLSRIMSKLIHPGNSGKLRREGVRFFLLWYQALGENSPPEVHAMYAELVPGILVPQKGIIGPSSSDQEYSVTDFLNHPNMKGEIGTSVFHDTGAHPVKPPEIIPLLPPNSQEKTGAPDPKDGIEILLDSMIHTTGLLRWRENTPQKHMKCFSFLLQRFREVYLPIFCPGFDNTTSIYEPKLALPVMRTSNPQQEVMSSCVYCLVLWLSKFCLDPLNTKYDSANIDEGGVDFGNLRFMGCTQKQLIRDVLFSSRDTINFIHEVFRQAFLMNYNSRMQIDAMKYAIAVYRDWVCGKIPPPFLLEPEESSEDVMRPTQRQQRLRTDSYLGAMIKENMLIRAGLQNILQVFFTHAANVFMVQTGHLSNPVSKLRSSPSPTTPLEEQIEICKKVLSIYRHMVMNVKKDLKTWEQLLLVLLQITSVILTTPAGSAMSKSKKNLGSKLAQPIFQTLIVTWIRAHTNANINSSLWEKFVSVLSSLTHREELIIEWNKTMDILTRVLGREVYHINLQDLPLDRLADPKNKRRRGLPSEKERNNQSNNDDANVVNISLRTSNTDEQNDNSRGSSHGRSIPNTPALSRSYSEGSLTPHRKSRGRRRLKSSLARVSLPNNVEHSLNRLLSTTSTSSVSTDVLNLIPTSQSVGTIGTSTRSRRRAVSLDSIRPGADLDDQECFRGSRSPSPTASSGIEGGSIKDSPMQIEMMACDSSSIDTQDDGSLEQNRSIIAGGKAKGWRPDVACIMWKRMLGALGDVNQIQNPDLHAKVFKYLYEITVKLIKIKLNQGISYDNLTTPPPPTLIPPIGITAPWCYGALVLTHRYTEGKLWALQLLCTIARNGGIGPEQLPLFYYALHQACDGQNPKMAFTALKYLGGSRFLSLMLPGHSILLLDLVHAATSVLTWPDTSSQTPRAEVAGLLGSLLCFPKTSLPKPALKPSEKEIIITEHPHLQDLLLNAVLRCARREPTTKARCIAIAALGQWVLQQLTNPSEKQTPNSFKQSIPQQGTSNQTPIYFNPRITEVIQVLLQALQFRHKTIACVTADALKLCSEQGINIAKIELIPQLIIKALCIALEIQNVPNPKDSDKIVITSLLLCLGEFCMSLPLKILTDVNENDENLITNVLFILHQISIGAQTEHTKRFISDEDFDLTYTCDDVKEEGLNDAANYQTSETIQNCRSTIKLCANMVIMHLVTNLGHFPMGIGASRLSSLVEEQDDLSFGPTAGQNIRENDFSAQVLNSPNLQMFQLKPGLVASFVELPSLVLPGGGITAGLVTAKRQVRVLLRDLGGKACWDASILYKEPAKPAEDAETSAKIKTSTTQNIPHHNFPERFYGSSPYISSRNNYQMDPMVSTTIGMTTSPPRHTLRHRPPHQLPLAKDIAPDYDQLNDLLQYIGHTSPECLSIPNTPLNTAGPTPLTQQVEAQLISVILNQRADEQDYIARQNASAISENATARGNVSLDSTTSVSMSSDGSSGAQSKTSFTKDTTTSKIKKTSGSSDELLPFQYCRLLFSQLGLAGWERRKSTHLLNRTDKLMRELRNLDTQRCRETHKMAVIYVAAGQEDKNSILRNSCGSSTYEMFVSALGWEVELESHNGFLGGLPRVGSGATAPYYATPFLEVIYHVATRMPTDSPEAILNKTRHLGNDEVHIVWSEHNRDYRRDILPTEFCDILITVYPLKSGLFRVTVNKKPDVPWFGPIWDEAVISGMCLASLVRATAINASRAKRTSLPFYQQFYEERNRSLETISQRHREASTFEDFIARIFNPMPSNSTIPASSSTSAGSSASPPLATTLNDHQHHRSSTKSKSWQHPETTASAREVTQQTMAFTTISLDQPSPRPLRKLPHPFKTGSKKTSLTSAAPMTLQTSGTPPDSPTLPGRRFK